jgi:glutaredoxin
MRWRKVKTKRALVVMYTRQGCCLCDDAWQMLQEMSRIFPLDLQAVDIDGDAVLIERMNDRVPVIFVNGKERFWGRINRALLERLLHAETKGQG